VLISGQFDQLARRRRRFVHQKNDAAVLDVLDRLVALGARQTHHFQLNSRIFREIYTLVRTQTCWLSTRAGLAIREKAASGSAEVAGATAAVPEVAGLVPGVAAKGFSSAATGFVGVAEPDSGIFAGALVAGVSWDRMDQ